jgi:hypothetical protein
MNLKEVPLHHVCEPCIEGKYQRTSFPKYEATEASKLLEVVYIDVCKLIKTTFRGGAHYFVTFINDFSRKTHVYLLKTKMRGFYKFKAHKGSKAFKFVKTCMWALYCCCEMGRMIYTSDQFEQNIKVF